MASPWPDLPDPGELVYDLPDWPYPVYPPAEGARDYLGHAHLRLYASSDDGHVAVVEDAGPGLSVTNGAGHIWEALSMDFPDGPVTQVELYRCARDGGPGVHFDQYTGDPAWSGHRWRPLSDIGPAHPDYDAVTAWTAKWAAVILGTPETPFDDLLAGSSLGSEQALAIRAQTPAQASERFLKQIEHEEGSPS